MKRQLPTTAGSMSLRSRQNQNNQSSPSVMEENFGEGEEETPSISGEKRKGWGIGHFSPLSNRFHCPNCKRKFTAPGYLERHFELGHRGEDPKKLSHFPDSFPCYRCQETFETLELLQIHDAQQHRRISTVKSRDKKDKVPFSGGMSIDDAILIDDDSNSGGAVSNSQNETEIMPQSLNDEPAMMVAPSNEIDDQKDDILPILAPLNKAEPKFSGATEEAQEVIEPEPAPTNILSAVLKTGSRRKSSVPHRCPPVPEKEPKLDDNEPSVPPPCVPGTSGQRSSAVRELLAQSSPALSSLLAARRPLISEISPNNEIRAMTPTITSITSVPPPRILPAMMAPPPNFQSRQRHHSNGPPSAYYCHPPGGCSGQNGNHHATSNQQGPVVQHQPSQAPTPRLFTVSCSCGDANCKLMQNATANGTMPIYAVTTSQFTGPENCHQTPQKIAPRPPATTPKPSGASLPNVMLPPPINHRQISSSSSAPSAENAAAIVRLAVQLHSYLSAPGSSQQSARLFTDTLLYLQSKKRQQSSGPGSSASSHPSVVINLDADDSNSISSNTATPIIGEDGSGTTGPIAHSSDIVKFANQIGNLAPLVNNNPEILDLSNNISNNNSV